MGLEHIPRRSLALDAWEALTELGSNKLEFKKGEVLFGKIRPYFHKVSVAPFDGVCSADTIVIRAMRPDDYGLVAGDCFQRRLCTVRDRNLERIEDASGELVLYFATIRLPSRTRCWRCASPIS